MHSLQGDGDWTRVLLGTEKLSSELTGVKGKTHRASERGQKYLMLTHTLNSSES